MKEPHRLALVGLRFGEHLYSWLARSPARDRLRFVGACDLNVALARAFTRKHGIHHYRDLDQVLADDSVRAVALMTPPVGRARLVERIMEAGKDVLAPKPFELDAVAALRCFRRAEELDRVLHLNSPAPSLPADLAVVERWCRQYGLGRLVGVRGETWAPYHEEADGSWYDDPMRCPGAPIFRIGIYLLHDILQLTGMPESVHFIGGRLRTGRPTPDNGQLAMRFSGGALGSIFCSFCVRDGQPWSNALVLNFENGTIYRNVPGLRAGAGMMGGASLRLATEAAGGGCSVVRRARTRELSGDYQWGGFADALDGVAAARRSSGWLVAAGISLIDAMARSEASGLPEAVCPPPHISGTAFSPTLEAISSHRRNVRLRKSR